LGATLKDNIYIQAEHNCSYYLHADFYIPLLAHHQYSSVKFNKPMPRQSTAI